MILIKYTISKTIFCCCKKCNYLNNKDENVHRFANKRGTFGMRKREREREKERDRKKRKRERERETATNNKKCDKKV